MRLHELRLRGVWEEAPEDAITDALVAAGLARRRERLLAVTDSGREAHARWARLAPGTEGEGAARRAHGWFVPLNVRLLQVCAEWQDVAADEAVRAAYGPGVLARLSEIDDRVHAGVRRLAEHVPRFAVHLPGLAEARRRVESGEYQWLTSPRLDSYHNVWMRLHEDLLVALGLSRDDET